jgi:hypothetical protein
VETHQCFQNIDKVLAVPGITCAFLGELGRRRLDLAAAAAAAHAHATPSHGACACPDRRPRPPLTRTRPQAPPT